MINIIRIAGDAAAVLGEALCFVAGLARLAQTYSIGGVSTPSLARSR